MPPAETPMPSAVAADRAVPTVPDLRNTRIGIGFCIAAYFLFSSQDAVTKILVADLSVSQLLLIRFAAMVAFVLVLAGARTGLRRAFTSARPGVQVARGLVLVAEIALFATALRYLGLSETHAIFATAPLIATALAAPVLGEAVGWRRRVAVVVGFIGALVIIRPGLGVVQSAALIPLVCAALWAAYGILTRLASRTDPFETSMVYMASVSLVAVAPFGIATWQWPDAGQWQLIAWLVVVSVASHLFMIRALQYAEAAALQPFGYLALVFATILGYIVFDEWPDAMTVLGASIIVGSGLYVIWRERKVADPTGS